MKSKIKSAVTLIKSRTSFSAKTAVILGSGLGGLVEEVESEIEISTKNIPDYPVSTVVGHEGKLIFGHINKTPVIMVQGRTHLYEGYDVKDVVLIVRILKELGVENLIVSNAAGGANPDFTPGDLMIITDHINMMFRNPLLGPNDNSMGSRFPDMSEPYDKEYISIVEKSAKENNIPIQKGVYCAVTGPSYETAAEVRMFRKLGADAIGMSTVPDVIAARHAGMRVFGMSCITNLGTGMSQNELSHSEVTETANKVADTFRLLILDLISKI